MTDYIELIIAFISGLVVGVIPAYLGHLLSMRRTKKEEVLPYLTKLYGIVSNIMQRTDAEYVKLYYDEWIEAKINETIRERAIKDLTGEKNPQIPMHHWLPDTFGVSFSFFNSFKKLIEVAKECRDFESLYAEMGKKGLTHALGLRNSRLSGSLNMFHLSAEYVYQTTSGVIEKFENIQSRPALVSDPAISDALKTLLGLATHNLFLNGADLKKQLEKTI